jgi:hypothetical protein
MIASLAEEPLQKVTLNLFHKDYLEFQAIYGQGWSKEIRRLVRRHLRERRQHND